MQARLPSSGLSLLFKAIANLVHPSLYEPSASTESNRAWVRVRQVTSEVDPLPPSYRHQSGQP